MSQDYPGDAYCTTLANVFVTLYALANKPLDTGLAIWIGRTLYDIGAGMSPADAEAKHAAELRVALGLDAPPPPAPPAPPAPPPVTGVVMIGKAFFDHVWVTLVPSKLQAILATGLAGADGSNGQAVIDEMNALGAPYAGGEFQPHHNGPEGLPTYGFPAFYVSYMTNVNPPFYQIVGE